jgi:hypothetical protein
MEVIISPPNSFAETEIQGLLPDTSTVFGCSLTEAKHRIQLPTLRAKVSSSAWERSLSVPVPLSKPWQLGVIHLTTLYAGVVESAFERPESVNNFRSFQYFSLGLISEGLRS